MIARRLRLPDAARRIACVLGAAAAGAAGASGAEAPDASEPAPFLPADKPAPARGADDGLPAAFALPRDGVAVTGLRGGPRWTLEGSVERVATWRPQVRQGGVSNSLVDASNRVWLGWGRAAFGVGVGTQSPRIDVPLDPLHASMPQTANPSMSVGWRYSLSESSSFYAGATAARAWGEADALPQYGARAGVEWQAARSRLGFDGGRLGLQLDSGYRMSIRTRSGGVQIALRRNF